MKHLFRFSGQLLVVGMVLAFCSPALHSQQKDSVLVIQSPGNGPYRCCYDLLVTSRHPRGTTISEVRLRFLSGNPAFISGQSGSPSEWAIFQSASTIRWTANTTDAEIDSGETVSGFHACVADTGVFRMIVETRNLNGLLSADTLVFVCTGRDCDEAFFNFLPSDQACVFDIDLVNGNRVDMPINDFHLRMLTPGARFITSPSAQPSGWNRLRADSNLISYQTSGLLRFHQWVEGFRIALTTPGDSVRLAWWTTNFGDEICHDTVTLHCGLARADSLRIVRTTVTGDSCCRDLTLRNLHLPATPIEAFTLKVLTANATLVSAPVTPSGWSSSGLNASRDSVIFRTASGLLAGDTALFRNVCFDNSRAATDTVRYRWQSLYRGIMVTQGIGTIVCPRPLTAGDSLTARVDSTLPSTSRCIFLTLRNRNSRNAAITRLVVRISNQGSARTILSANAPAGWQVQSFTKDSVVYTGGTLLPGGSLAGFQLCVSLGDATTRDPLHLQWSTSNGNGSISGGSLDINAIIVESCDSIGGTETIATDANICCFRIRFYNRNTQKKAIDGVLLGVVDQSMVFSEAGGQGAWSLATTTFPSMTIGFLGGSLAPGDSTPELTVCVRLQGVPGDSTEIPLLWSTFSGATVVCSDTVRLVCRGTIPNACDTVVQISSDNTGGICAPGFRLVNRHTPASTIDEVRFTITGGKGRFIEAVGTDAASRWTAVMLKRDTVIFRGDSVLSDDSTERFILRIDSTDGAPLQIQACSARQGLLICCSSLTVDCQTSDVELSLEPTGFRLHENVPNPFSTSTEIRYELLKPAPVALTIRDESGKVVRHIDEGMKGRGEHRIHVDGSDLPSGVYYYWLEVGGERLARRMVLVR